MTTTTGAPLFLQRTYHVLPDDLQRAWVEPELFRRWFQPIAGVEAHRLVLEARAGGKLEARFALPDESELEIDGRFRALEPGRIVLELVRSGTGRPRGGLTVVTATFEPRAGTTTLALRHEGLRPGEAAELEEAWQRCLGRLAGACRGSVDHFYGRLERYPRFRSRFGGLWPDLSNAAELVAGKQALGRLTPADAELFRHWIEKGFVVLPGAVPAETIDRLCAELERDWTRGNPSLVVEVFEHGQRTLPRLAPRYRDVPHKVLDYHAISRAARDVQFAPAILRFLGQLFERPPLAFQSLCFRWGSEQELHQDSGYVVLRSPMEFVGCWIALEDVRSGSGELQYYVGSHRIPEYLWFGRGRSKPYEFDDVRDFVRHVRVESERLGCPLERFRPGKGDALIWHADLVHGGAKRERPELTRQSMVSHFCPLDVDPVWLGEIPSSEKLEHVPGGYYCHPLPGALPVGPGGPTR